MIIIVGPGTVVVAVAGPIPVIMNP